MKTPSIFRLGLLCILLCIPSTPWSGEGLRIGVTLHPYYSWVSNIVPEGTEVVPVLSPSSDPHSYQPLPEDIQKLAGLDALVINGLGHDAFIMPMLQALGDKAPEVIKPNTGIPVLESSGADSANAAPNSHTFLSITSATHQIGTLAAALQRLDPANATEYRQKARAYKRRLRGLLTAALAELKQLRTGQVHIGTVHDGYSYLFQELGLKVQAVVQPRHGVQPSPSQLADSIKRIKASGINLLFAEMNYDQKFVDIILEETGTRIARLSHISTGPYSATQYELEMAANLRAILDAIKAMQ